MAVLADTHPTLYDLAKRTDPNGQIAQIVELLGQTNEILTDMVWQEGNLPTGHKTTVRTGLPTVTWRKLYGGVQPSKSKTAQITESTGMLEAYAEIDKALADLNGNTAAWRMTEEGPFREAMNQQVAETLFTGNEATAPETFTGFGPRFNSLSAENAQNIVAGGGSGSDNASIWLVVWGPDTCHGIIPKGSTAGIQVRDLGEVTVENVDGSNGRAQMYRTHYRWDAGLCVRDWRYVARIANIDRSLLTYDLSTGANLNDLMFQAIEAIPNIGMGRAAFYMDRHVRTMLRRQTANAVKNSSLEVSNVGGVMTTSFNGIPIRRVDRLYVDEATVN